MGTDDKLNEQFEQFRKLGAENENVDVGALMINALERAKAEEVDRKKARWAYVGSVVLAPLGLFIALYYALSGKPGGKRIALNCVIITVVMLVVGWLTLKMFLSTVTPDQMRQIQTVNPNDLKAILQP